MRRQLVFLFTSLCVQCVYSQDYCGNLTRITHEEKRYIYYKTSDDEKLLNDRFLHEGWYNIPGSLTIASSAPGLNSCGSLYPIWRREKQGNESTMCIQSSATEHCYREFKIRSGVCGNKEVFQLKKSMVYYSAYCLAPAQIAHSSVEVNLNHKGSMSELVFSCKFNKQPNDSIWYRTDWLVDGQQIHVAGPILWGDDLVQEHALTEQHLRKAGINTVGFHIRCSVRASFGPDSAQSFRALSSSRFIGIKVPESVALKEGETKRLELQLTTPFGCGVNTDKDWCQLPIATHSIAERNTEDSCDVQMLTDTCDVSVRPATWNRSVVIELVGRTSQVQTTAHRTMQMKLKTGAVPSNSLWGDYDLRPITVQLIKESSTIKSKYCYSVAEPRMMTHDGRRYEHHMEGTFTLFKHDELPIEVQLQTTPCSGPVIMCNCGVAVRAGRNVFEISKCGERPAWHIGYSMCDDNSELLLVKKNGRKYEIYLPTGGKVIVSTWNNFLNVYVYPSIQDYKKSRGLCGYLSGDCKDDFVLRDGSYSLDATSRSACDRDSGSYLPMFTESWKVPEIENLFKHENFEGGFPNAWSHSLTFCTCPDGNMPLDNQVECKPTKPYKICNTLPGYVDVPSTCTISSKRQKRFIQSWTPVTERFKRQSEHSWTEETARAHCEKAFQDSATVRVCQNVTERITMISLDNCVQDIMWTRSTEFTSFAIDTVRSICQEEVLVNPELQQKDESLNKSVFDIVVEKVCPNDCTKQGECVQGRCECRDPYGGTDCSVDLGVPPRLAWAGNQGHCDTSEENCDVLSVYGETFVDGAICHVEQIKIHKSSFEVTDRRAVEAVVASISEVRCQVGLAESVAGNDGDFIMAYRLSVSNRGDGFPPGVPVMVYDGRCIDADVTATQFKWETKGPYCFYKGTCLPAQIIHPKNYCLICEVSHGVGSWIKRSGSNCENSQTPKDDALIVTVVGAIVAAIVFAVVVVVIVVCVVLRRRLAKTSTYFLKT